jgi:formylglycine-generating enzyme required for sulfatase activity
MQEPIADGAESIAGKSPDPLAATELDSLTCAPDPDATVTANASARLTRQPAESAPIPAKMGRYEVTRLIGRGGFGAVYLAHDGDLSRRVAIKVPHPEFLRSAAQVESFLNEARIAAALHHPSIVGVHDIGRIGECGVYVVFEYVEGRNLAEVLECERLSPSRVARLLIPVAEAAHHAHHAGLVHRDLKPSNILLDDEGHPHITDFGLALREELQGIRSGEVAGTPHYMAPEQVRGETHRLDGRTDVWALGVILYMGLLYRQPFSGRDAGEVFDEVLHRDPKPPRQLNDRIPRELERICLKCLSKRMADRYETAGDLADDLKRWLVAEASTDAFPSAQRQRAAAPGGPGPLIARVVPKGLRAFDSEDAGFFLSLVPGPRDSDGVPDSIRAWKRRVEERDPARTFPVGLLYGPSGSGKSSLVKAGLLPLLSRQVHAVYVEASPNATESSLLSALVREIPSLATSGRLDLAMAAIRERGSKVLLVVDQFEQWLQHHPDKTDGELVQALRQCDGQGLQAMLLVRDDFWMAVTRFFRALEVRVVEGHNSAPVELFDLQHARNVLTELGRALGRIPDGPIVAGSEHARFLDKAASEIASADGRVIPVRLTLCAEMLRHREWSTKTLRDLGGMEGIGVTFLEETFSAPNAPPAHRVHQRAARAVLSALLPDSTTDLKGRWRSARLLQESAGYSNRPQDFTELIRILDDELRMITPVDPSSVEADETGATTSAAELCYQLTHDYLVPPLRQWLFRKQRETLRGRAELKLAEITALWRDRPESRRLPSVLEWLKIVCFTRHRIWSVDERRMMRAAGRRVLTRAAAVVALAMTVAYATFAFLGRERARSALESALKSDYESLPRALPQIAAQSAALRPALEKLEGSDSTPPHEREIAEILLYREWPTPARAAFLVDNLLKAVPDEVMVIGDALAAHPDKAGLEKLRSALHDESAEPDTRLRVACALAKIEPASIDSWTPIAPSLAEALLVENRRDLGRWITQLGSAASILVPPLGAICCDATRESTVQSTAALAVAEILDRTQQPRLLAQFTVDASPDASDILTRELVRTKRSTEILDFLHGVLKESAPDPVDGSVKDKLSSRQAAAAIALAGLGEPESLWPLLEHRGDPRLRSLLIQRLAANALSQRILVDRLSNPSIDAAEHQALLLAWAEMRPTPISTPARGTITALARSAYKDNPDAGVHSAAELLLRRFGGLDVVAHCESELRTSEIAGKKRRWELGPNGHTFAVLPGPLEFRMGAGPNETAHYGYPVSHYRRIDRSLWVATKEVTVQQFQAFNPAHRNEPRYGDEPGCAAIHISWYAAAAYCNWLSQQAGIDKKEWCYPEKVDPGMVIDAENVARTGFRLPTEAEWEYFCRAGTDTARPFGESPELLARYAWTWLNSGNRAMPPGLLLPNEFGLFDVLGNVWEWCQDGPIGHYSPHGSGFPQYPTGTKESPADDAVASETIDAADRAHETWRILRGGAFSYAPDRARSAWRDWEPSNDTREYLGLRVVRTVGTPKR